LNLVVGKDILDDECGLIYNLNTNISHVKKDQLNLLTNAQCKSSASYDKTRFSKTSPLLLLLEKAKKKKEGEKCLRTIDYAILLSPLPIFMFGCWNIWGLNGKIYI
jgi:hypothetical protein